MADPEAVAHRSVLSLVAPGHANRGRQVLLTQAQDAPHSGRRQFAETPSGLLTRPAGRVRSAGMLLEAGGFLSPGTQETGLFDVEGTDGSDEREGA